MDLIQGYRDEGEDDSKQTENTEPLPQPILKKMHVDVAPSVAITKQVDIIIMFDFLAWILDCSQKQQEHFEI